MAAEQASETTRRFEHLLADADAANYVLRLYVTGMTPRSQQAVANIKEICEQHLKHRHSLEIVDLFQNPHLAEGEQIIAAPTLIKQLPLPLRRVVGDLSDQERVLVGLDLRPKE